MGVRHGAPLPDAEEAHTWLRRPKTATRRWWAAELPEDGTGKPEITRFKAVEGNDSFTPCKGVQIRAEQRADHALDGLSQKGKRLRLAHRRPRLSEIRGLIFDYAPSMISRKRS